MILSKGQFFIYLAMLCGAEILVSRPGISPMPPAVEMLGAPNH